MQTAFNLQLIAKKSNHKEAEIQPVLHKLKGKEIIEYHSKNNDSTLIFNEVREDERTISRVSKYLENQNQLKKEQLQSVLNYITEKKVCKNKLILNYFGEKTDVDCGICSFCITKKNKKKDNTSLSAAIIALLQSEDLNSRDIQNRTKNNPDEVIFALQNLLENNTILVKPNNKYTLKS
jgi:ATP-dependent DNA helicase RecQ